MNTSVGDEVKKIYGKEFSDKVKRIGGRGSRLLTVIIIAVPIGAVLVVALAFVFYFNKFVILQQAAFAQGSRIENEYQRRIDLIPKLTSTVLEYAEHERALFKFVSDTRELKLSVEKIENPPSSLKGPLFDKSLSKLMALAEQYPNVKATQSYQDLMKKIEATEDRISLARGKYSALINTYNKTVCSFPDNVFALVLGFGTLEPYHPKKEPMPLRNKRIFWP